MKWKSIIFTSNSADYLGKLTWYTRLLNMDTMCVDLESRKYLQVFTRKRTTYWKKIENRYLTKK